MKKNFIYLIVLFALGLATYFFVFKTTDSQAFSKTEANFTFKDTNEIQTIFISNLQNQNIKLSKTSNGWKLNDSLTPREDAVSFLLDALYSQKADQPVPLKFHDDVLKELSATGIKVELFNQAGKMATFYVAKNAGPDNVTYMLTEGAKRVYIVKIPLRDLFLGVRYMTSVQDWRSKKIFPASKNEIESIEVAYKDSTQYNYKITQSLEGKPTITGSVPSSKPINANVLNAYLNSWTEYYCYGYEERNKIKDTIFEHGKELATLTFKKRNKPAEILSIYFKPISQGTKGTIELDGAIYDFDVFIGFLNKQDMMTISKSNVEKMVRSLPDFFGK